MLATEQLADLLKTSPGLRAQLQREIGPFDFASPEHRRFFHDLRCL